MKRLIAPILLVFSCVAATAATPKFTSTLASDELAAAGIDGLTPAQVERLNALIERYKSGEVSREVGEAVKVAREEEKQEASRRPVKPDKRIESRLVGSLNGWRGGTVFVLENGDKWQLSNPESYKHAKTVTNPEVRIEKSIAVDYWMYIEGFPRVRVKRIQ